VYAESDIYAAYKTSVQEQNGTINNIHKWVHRYVYELYEILFRESCNCMEHNPALKVTSLLDAKFSSFDETRISLPLTRHHQWTLFSATYTFIP
jgi:hypothetical protein